MEYIITTDEQTHTKPNLRRLFVSVFVDKFNASSKSDDVMPEHIWFRWFGKGALWYEGVWSGLNGDEDDFLFDDWCEVGCGLDRGDRSYLEGLQGKRLHKLFLFSFGMLSHYLWKTLIWEFLGFAVRHVYVPLGRAYIRIYGLVRHFYIVQKIRLEEVLGLRD